jgi:hypothetical protein
MFLCEFFMSTEMWYYSGPGLYRVLGRGSSRAGMRARGLGVGWRRLAPRCSGQQVPGVHVLAPRPWKPCSTYATCGALTHGCQGSARGGDGHLWCAAMRSRDELDSVYSHDDALELLRSDEAGGAGRPTQAGV